MAKKLKTAYVNHQDVQTALDWHQATGEIEIPLVNDYLFRALLQKNNHVLKGLIASLLHIPIEEIDSVKIENEIQLGEHISQKYFILDIRVCMNNHSIINLEMQVVDQKNWVERSMTYLCRCYDNLSQGEDYINTKPAIQIGLLNYTYQSEIMTLTDMHAPRGCAGIRLRILSAKADPNPARKTRERVLNIYSLTLQNSMLLFTL